MRYFRVSSRLICMFLIYSFIILNLPTIGKTQTLDHTLKFYLDPELTTSLTAQELKDRISLYAEDISSIFAKQTLRRFIFNPEENIFITETAPYSGTYSSPLCNWPMSGYEIWIYAQLTDDPIYGTHGGSVSVDRSGAGVATKLYWDAIHDRTTLADGSAELMQYWRQIDHIVHEMGHIFGAAHSEYYNLAIVDDKTETEPIQPINIGNFATDPYWLEHNDYWADPLFWSIWNSGMVGHPTSYSDLMDAIAFADVSVSIINASFRGCLEEYLPDLNQTRVHVVNEVSRDPISNVSVKIWTVKCMPAYDAELIVDAATNQSGYIEFDWDGQHNTSGNLMVIKAYPDGKDPIVKWFSIFDAEEEKMVYGHDNLDIYLEYPYFSACGDLDGIEGINVLDIVYIINYKYKDGPAPVEESTADVDGIPPVNILDIVYLINYIYKDGPALNCP